MFWRDADHNNRRPDAVTTDGPTPTTGALRTDGFFSKLVFDTCPSSVTPNSE
jgi:hypothetical protein